MDWLIGVLFVIGVVTVVGHVLWRLAAFTWLLWLAAQVIEQAPY